MIGNEFEELLEIKRKTMSKLKVLDFKRFLQGKIVNKIVITLMISRNISIILTQTIAFSLINSFLD